MRQEFTFDQEHCDDHNVAFIADGWPVKARSTPNKLKLSGVHGTLRYPGRVLEEMSFAGTMYLLDPDNQMITYHETLTRTAELSRWLCPDGRRRLTLDAMPDRFYMAEQEEEITVEATDWGNGSVKLNFILQPLTYALLENTLSTSLTASKAKDVAFHVEGTESAPVGFELTATGSVVNQIELSLPDGLLRFSNLNLRTGQTMSVRYDLEIGEIMLITVNGSPGSKYMQPASTVPFEAAPGHNTLRLTASGACNIRVFARGRWR